MWTVRLQSWVFVFVQTDANVLMTNTVLVFRYDNSDWSEGCFFFLSATLQALLRTCSNTLNNIIMQGKSEKQHSKFS